MKKVFKTIFKWILISVLPIYLVVAYFVFGLKVQDRVCEKVDVNIVDRKTVQYLRVEDIEKQIERFKINPKGKYYKDINTEEMERCLKENKLIADAQCYKTPQGKVWIEIRQRIPVLRIMTPSESYYIDKEGVIIPTTNNFCADLLLVTGEVTRQYASKELSKLIRFLLEHEFWNAQISQIHVDEKHQLELIPRVGDQLILFGEIKDFEEKFDNLYCFYKQVLSQVGWNKYDIINLKFKNQVVCSLRGARKELEAERRVVPDSLVNSDEEIELPENNVPDVTNL